MPCRALRVMGTVAAVPAMPKRDTPRGFSPSDVDRLAAFVRSIAIDLDFPPTKEGE